MDAPSAPELACSPDSAESLPPVVRIDKRYDSERSLVTVSAESLPPVVRVDTQRSLATASAESLPPVVRVDTQSDLPDLAGAVIAEDGDDDDDDDGGEEEESAGAQVPQPHDRGMTETAEDAHASGDVDQDDVAGGSGDADAKGVHEELKPLSQSSGSSAKSSSGGKKHKSRSPIAEGSGEARRWRMVSLLLGFLLSALVLSLGIALLVAQIADDGGEADAAGATTAVAKVDDEANAEPPAALWTAGADVEDMFAYAEGEQVMARSLAERGCHTATEGEPCHDAVEWAMREGIHSNPEWYRGLNAASSFEDFQLLLHKRQQKRCAMPCMASSLPAAEEKEEVSEEMAEAEDGTPVAIRRRRRQHKMTSCRRRHSSDGDKDLPPGWGCLGSKVGPVPPTPVPTTASPTPVPPSAAPTPAPPTTAPTTAPTVGPYINNYNGSNPFRIKADPVRSNNYFMILGDWGKFGGAGPCQIAVAQKMKEYAARQKAEGKTLLAVVTVGDNFYWTGARPEFWGPSWGDIYGTEDPDSPLYKVPWMASLGNHDYGDNDAYAFCPHVAPKAMIDGQPYASQQFNADRNPTRPAGTDLYWFPDYNFHYELPEADLEFIFVDKNYQNVVHHLGPHSPGFVESFRKCGGREVVSTFMRRVSEAGTRLLQERARLGSARTTVILQHYPEEKFASENAFLDNLPEGRKSKLLQAFGHWHDQFCHRRDANGTCDMILTGGGGGCCGGHRAGFTAVHLQEDGGFTTDYDSEKVAIPAWQCHWRRRV
eukprot:TRINITY_DN1778_c1_g1_i1.p1 TRINITY_DN1778_c1_g1~~TRINITY_DN1778_c1_g1_i1.p1  ORF type:complete len:804 (-),score=192.41 TRINITY_DN1778_c1_g1_i1:177-2480(-)